MNWQDVENHMVTEQDEANNYDCDDYEDEEEY